MFVEALKMVADSFDALFYVPDRIDISSDNTRKLEQTLSDRWQTEVNLTLTRRYSIPVDTNTYSRYLRPALNFHRIPDYMETSGPEQVQALESFLQGNPDFIFVHRLRCMPPIMLTQKKLPPVFLDMDDIEHIAFKRSIKMPPKWKSKWLLNLQIPALISGEKKSIRLARNTFVCSATDKQELGKLGYPTRIEVIPNAVHIPETCPLTKAKRVMILGQYAYEPNRIGAEYFIDQVWGRIYSELPEARLIVAGPGPEHIRQFGSPPPGVEFTGFVNDLETLYKSIRVVVCPVLSGGGTRVKLIEAAAFTKPILSTTIGAEGLDFENGKQLLVRDEPQKMTEACIALLTDDTLANRLATASHKATKENYERSEVAKKIAQIFTMSL